MSYDPWQGYDGNTEGSGQSEDDFINMLYNAGASGGQMPGKTAAARLSYLKSVEGLLGVPLTALAGQAGVSQETPLPFQSQQRAIYGYNPMYNDIFDAIDNNADPDSALLTAQVKSEADDPTGYANAYRAAVDYATEKVKYNQSIQQSQGSYTAPDGSKYKNAPLGGTDIYGMADEYDLMGAPDEAAMIDLYAKSKGKQIGGYTKNLSANRGYDVAPGVTAVHGDYNGKDRVAKGVLDPVARDRLNIAKRTQVRSDANLNTMNRIMAMKALLGG